MMLQTSKKLSSVVTHIKSMTLDLSQASQETLLPTTHVSQAGVKETNAAIQPVRSAN